MNLDNTSIYKKYDTGRVAESIELLPDQMRQVLGDARLIKIPREYNKITNVVVSGMGGSNLGTHFTRSAWGDKIKVPVSIIAGYEVPAYVDKNTLFLISSYSGTTEEPLSTYRIAKKRGAKIAAITENSKKSKLLKIMLRDNVPGYIFKPDLNPSGQPRLGVGYSIFGQAVIMAKTGLFSIKTKEMEDIIANLEIWTRKLRPISPASQNLAKKLCTATYKKIPIFVASQHLAGNLHVVRNQMNECSKQFADYLEIPDLNHHLMEGLQFPGENKKILSFVFFMSKFYDKRIEKRFELTRQIVKKNKIATHVQALKGKTKLIESFELLQLGEWLSYYLGILNQINPAEIPYVDWFKSQLKITK
jgi:glucose/mannose-6-phosphate isomerase